MADDYEVCASAEDFSWRPAGAASKNVNALVHMVADWSPDVIFMLVPREAAEPLRLELYQRPDEVPNG